MSMLPQNGKWQCPSKFNLPSPAIRFKRYLSVDTETSGLDFRHPLEQYNDQNELFLQAPARVFIVTACNQDGTTWFWRFRMDPRTRHVKENPKNVSEIKALIKSYPILVFHNALFDLEALRHAPCYIDLSSLLEAGKIHDTLAMSHVLDSSEPHGLKALAEKYCAIQTTDEDILRQTVIRARDEAKRLGIPRGPSVNTDYFLPYELLHDNSDEEYAIRDTIRTILLFRFYLHNLKKQKLWNNYIREQQALIATHEMQSHGLEVRPRVLDRELKKYSDMAAVSNHSLQRVARRYGNGNHLNPNSPKQLIQILYTDLALPVLPGSQTPKGNPSTDKTVLPQLGAMAEEISEKNYVRKSWGRYGLAPGKLTKKDDRERWKDAASFLASLLEYRKYSTASKYLLGYKEAALLTNGKKRVYTSLNPWGTITTRYSSSRPNLENVGKQSEIQLRQVFGPSRGKVWYSFDYNQLELRLMAYASGDPTLKRVLEEGLDRHQITADALDVPRSIGKNINFAWQYGAGDKKLSIMSGIDAAEFVEKMSTAYPKVIAFMRGTIADVKRKWHKEKYGYVHTLFGYRLGVRFEKSYTGANYIVQGTAGDVLKNSIIAIHEYIREKELQKKLAMILPVHDEIILEASVDLHPSHMKNIKTILESAGKPIGCHLPVDMKKISLKWSASTSPKSSS